jgi:hypothetical protein
MAINSPGYRRLLARAGPDAYKRMLEDTVRRQQAAIESVKGERDPATMQRLREPRRETEYPKPQEVKHDVKDTTGKVAKAKSTGRSPTRKG